VVVSEWSFKRASDRHRQTDRQTVEPVWSSEKLAKRAAPKLWREPS